MTNRPGLSAIAYRIGTYASFRKEIVDAISRTAELAHLTSRTSDDYTITAIELWSAVADVLTFYHERIANEAFLRTATLRDSMLRLVRLLGYELAPGAAATTQLAFTLEPGFRTLIAAGTRVQSVPGEGEKPQKYETLTSIQADARLNRLRAFPAPERVLTAVGSGSANLAPDNEALAAGATLVPGDRVLLYTAGAIEVLTVDKLRAHDDMLEVSWALPIGSAAFADAYDASKPGVSAYKLGRSFHLFGYDAPETVVIARKKTATDETSAYLALATTDFNVDTSIPNQIALDGRYPGLKQGSVVLAVSGAAVHPLRVISVAETLKQRTATVPGITPPVTAVSGTVTTLGVSSIGTSGLPTGDIRDVVVYELIGEPLRFWPWTYAADITAGEIYLPGRRTGWSTVEVNRTVEKGAYKPGITLDATDLVAGREVLLADAKGGEPVAAKVAAAALIGDSVSFGPTDTDSTTVTKLGLGPGQAIPLTALVSADLATTVALRKAKQQLIVKIGDLPAQTIALQLPLNVSNHDDVASALQTAIRSALPGAPTFAQCIVKTIHDAICIVPGVPGDRVEVEASLNDAETVVDLSLDAKRVRFLDGVITPAVAPLLNQTVSGSVRVSKGVEKPVFTSVTPAAPATVDAMASLITNAFDVNAFATDEDRIVVLPHVPKHEERAYVRLNLDVNDAFALDMASAVLLGNVVSASHGETVHEEIVGDGDASQAFQKFSLKKKPVTYVPAAVPGGVESSLKLFVNGVEWREAPSLYGARPTDGVFVARIADDGTLSVQFGDGEQGTRLPTGRQNIVATYRQGIGLEGRVDAAKLTTLLDRATGVKGATNLLAADGGANPETMARARETAPGTVRTFGRAVSLRDFEDNALLAGEVAKTSATWVWTGERRIVHLTVAAQGGRAFSDEGLKRLAATLASERDPNHKLEIANYSPVAVLVDASLIVKASYITDRVLAAARAVLLDAFSFDRRSFAEPVYLSDVYAIFQNVEGVLAVDINTLDLKNTEPAFRAARGVGQTITGPYPRLLMLPARPIDRFGHVLPAELAFIETPSQDVVLRAQGGTSS